jgi:hypothetical protein
VHVVPAAHQKHIAALLRKKAIVRREQVVGDEPPAEEPCHSRKEQEQMAPARERRQAVTRGDRHYFGQGHWVIVERGPAKKMARGIEAPADPAERRVAIAELKNAAPARLHEARDFRDGLFDRADVRQHADAEDHVVERARIERENV